MIPFRPGPPTAALQNHAVGEYPTATGPADYGLFVMGRFLGVLEAKRLSLGPQNALIQAERYSRGAEGTGLDFSGYRVPFLYASNGEVIWFHDVRHSAERSRRIAAFHVAAALQERLTRDFEAEGDRLRQLPNIHPRLRLYPKPHEDACDGGGKARTRGGQPMDARETRILPTRLSAAIRTVAVHS